MKVAITFVLLLAGMSFGADVINVVPGIYSKSVTSVGLYLPASNTTFSPITTLTTTVHLDKAYSVFVHYQLSVEASTTDHDIYTKLIVNEANAGSLVHSGKQENKNPTGFWMANLNEGHYTFELHYKSSAAITMSADLDYQTAILQVMWFEDAHVVSDGIKCYPTPTATNSYNNWGPINDLQVVLEIPENRVILSAYQLSTEMSSPSHVVTALDVNGFYQQSTPFVKGNDLHLDLHGTWAAFYTKGIHYFNVLYMSPTPFSFTDCEYEHTDNENLYAMMLPPSCNVVTINPRENESIRRTTSWRETDLKYGLTLDKICHVIVTYQYSGGSGNEDKISTPMRIDIESSDLEHTISYPGISQYIGNYGQWQGFLEAGKHEINIEYRSSHAGASTTQLWQTRAMNIVYCC